MKKVALFTSVAAIAAICAASANAQMQPKGEGGGGGGSMQGGPAQAPGGQGGQQSGQRGEGAQQGAPERAEPKSGGKAAQGERPNGKAAEGQKEPGKGSAEKGVEPKDKATKGTAQKNEPNDRQKGAQKNEPTDQQKGAQKNQPTDQQKGAQKNEPTDKSNNKGTAEKSRQPGEKAGTAERTTEPKDKSASGGQRTQLSQEQRGDFSRTLMKERNVNRANRLNISINVGTRVPRSVRLVALPATLVSLVPAYRSYRYVVVDEQICIIDPASYEIVEVIPVSGEMATGPGHSDRLVLSEDERMLILREVDTQGGSTLGLGAISVGADVPRDVEVRVFPEAVVAKVPKVRDYKYFAVEDRIAVVDPQGGKVALVIDNKR